MPNTRKKPYRDRTVCVGSGARSPGINWCPFCEQFIYTRNDGNLMKHFAPKVKIYTTEVIS